MKLLACCLLSLVALAGVAQGPAKKPAANAPASVTESEAKATFARAEKILRKLTKSTRQVQPISLAGSNSVSREKVVLQLDRLYEIVRPTTKLTPRPIIVNVRVLKMSGGSKDKLVRLVKLGAVGNYGTLAAGPDNKLSVREFGDTLGFFMARMAEMTHMPNPKWSPPLMDGD